jgi:hypothetical protein
VREILGIIVECKEQGIIIRQRNLVIMIVYEALERMIQYNISNNPGFRLKHPGVLDGSDGSDGTSYPLTENYTLPVAQATGRVA